MSYRQKSINKLYYRYIKKAEMQVNGGVRYEKSEKVIRKSRAKKLPPSV